VQPPHISKDLLIHICRSQVTHANASWNYEEREIDSCTGRRRCIRCIKLQGSFRTRVADYRALLRKTTYKDKASYASPSPCMWRECHDVKQRIFKLLVSFHKRATNYMALLLKNKTPYASPPPCNNCTHIQKSVDTHMHESRHTCKCVMADIRKERSWRV